MEIIFFEKMKKRVNLLQITYFEKFIFKIIRSPFDVRL